MGELFVRIVEAAFERKDAVGEVRPSAGRGGGVWSVWLLLGEDTDTMPAGLTLAFNRVVDTEGDDVVEPWADAEEVAPIAIWPVTCFAISTILGPRYQAGAGLAMASLPCGDVLDARP